MIAASARVVVSVSATHAVDLGCASRSGHTKD